MGKASRRSRGHGHKVGSPLKTLQHALHQWGLFANGDLALTPEVEKAGAYVQQEMLNPLINGERLDWVARVERSLDHADAPEHALEGWQDVMNNVMAQGFKDLRNEARWIPLSILVRVQRTFSADADAARIMPLFTETDALVQDLGQRWSIPSSAVRVGRWKSKDLGEAESLIDVFQKSLGTLSAEPIDEADAHQQNRAAFQAFEEVLRHADEDFDPIDDDPTMFDDDLGLALGDADASTEPYHLMVYTTVRQDALTIPVDLDQLTRALQTSPLMLRSNEHVLETRVLEVGYPVPVSTHLALLDTITPLNDFLDGCFARTGHSWNGVKAIVYPVYDPDVIDPQEASVDEMEQEVVGAHVVLWSEGFNEVIGTFAAEVYDGRGMMSSAVLTIPSVLDHHGLANVELHPPYPLMECDGCGATMFWVPKQGQADLVLMHSTDDAIEPSQSDEVSRLQ